MSGKDVGENNSEQNTVYENIKASADAQKAAIDAQKAAIEAMKISSRLEPQEGKTTVDDKFGYISQLIAYQVLKKRSEKIADEIASKLAGKPETRILIVHDLDVATEDLAWLHVKSLSEILTKKVDDRIAENNKIKPAMKLAALPVIAAMGAFSLIVDILGYFKTDYNIKGQQFTLENHAILANVSNALNKKDISVQIFKFNRVESSNIILNFEKLLGKKAELEISLASLKTLLPEDTSGDKKSGKNIDLAKLNACILATEALGTELSSFLETVTKTPDDKSPPILLKAILRQYIKDEKFTHFLNLKILSAGGEAVTMQKRIGPSGKLQFIGGCAISYILVEVDGTFVKANTHHGLAYLNYDLGEEESSLNIHDLGTFDDPVPEKDKKWYK